MAYLVDTDIIVDWLADDREAVKLLDSLFADGVSLSAVTFMEVLHGLLLKSDVEGEIKFTNITRRSPILPFDERVAAHCAELRADLQLQGKRVRPRALDLISAATAMHYGLTLVTRNVVDYDDILDLSLFEF